MEEKIKNHLVQFNKKQGWNIDEGSLVESVTDAAPIKWEGNFDKHRWWTCCTRVVEIDGMFIGFTWAITTGDENANDLGWEFDPESIHFVEPYEVTETRYRPV
jgi:hypothetical protein